MPASKLQALRAKGDEMETDIAGDCGDPTEQFKDADDDAAVPSLPPMKVENVSDTGGEKGSAAEEDVKEGGATEDAGKADLVMADNAGSPVPRKESADGSSSSSSGGGSGPGPSGLLSAAPPASLANDFRGGQESWNAMLYQLLLYKAQRGDLNIPHNDTSYRLLYNWVQTQRKHYKLYQENRTSSTFLNADRIAVLDAIDFQWNVRGDTFWQKNYEGLAAYRAEHGDVRVPRLYAKNPKLGEWVTDQRRQWKSKMEGKPNMMTDERKARLDDLGFVWKVRDRADWNDRYEQLLEFKKENGHCIVPQHYARNRALGKWVAKQREQYRFYREGKHSFLTEERIDLLKSVGFVWQIKGRGAKAKAAAQAQQQREVAAAVGGKLPSLSLPVDGMLTDDVEGKSLAKVEEEEMKEREGKDENCVLGMSSAAAVAAAAAAGAAHVEELSLKDPPEVECVNKGSVPPSPRSDKKVPLPSLPAISQQQLLQANMAAIAAHASSNQNMVADLAAVLRFGGGGAGGTTATDLLGTGPPIGGAGGVLPGLGNDPRTAAAAALRAAQVQLGGGNDPKDRGAFTTMI